MVCFKTKNQDLGKIWALERKMLVYFMAIRNILRPFGIFYGHLVYVVAIWCSLRPFGIFFPFWYVWAKKNLATLDLRSSSWRSRVRIFKQRVPEILHQIL
jgi:hypothetical protein